MRSSNSAAQPMKAAAGKAGRGGRADVGSSNSAMETPAATKTAQSPAGKTRGDECAAQVGMRRGANGAGAEVTKTGAAAEGMQGRSGPAMKAGGRQSANAIRAGKPRNAAGARAMRSLDAAVDIRKPGMPNADAMAAMAADQEAAAPAVPAIWAAPAKTSVPFIAAPIPPGAVPAAVVPAIVGALEGIVLNSLRGRQASKGRKSASGVVGEARFGAIAERQSRQRQERSNAQSQ